MLPKRLSYTRTVDLFSRINPMLEELGLDARFIVRQTRRAMSTGPAICTVTLVTSKSSTLVVQGRSRDVGAFAFGILQTLMLISDEPSEKQLPSDGHETRWKPTISLVR